MAGDKPTPNVFFEISIADKPAGRVEFKLYDDVAPKTAANFRGLATGFKADGTTPLPPKFGYKGSPFHRVIPGFMLQGGDFENRDGTGGHSIYGSKFDDEKFVKKHDSELKLEVCANAGPNSNGSQFFTTIDKCEWLDGKHVVFGEVVSGLDVIKAIEKLGNKEGKMPSKDKLATVKDCGVVKAKN